MNLHSAIVQFTPKLGDPVYNLKKVDELSRSLNGVDLIVLPELANAGYNFRDYDEALACSESIENGTFTKFLFFLARKKNCYIVSGINENDGGTLYNTAILAGPDGLIGKYRKVHLFMNEKDYFEPGNLDFPVFNIKGATVGLQICFDYLFPEPWGILARKGAEVICHPSNLVTRFAFKVLPAHAVSNRIYILTANRTGTERNLKFTGRSQVLDPKGNVMVKASAGYQEVLEVVIDTSLSKNKMITERNHVFRDRRPDLYKE